MFTINAQDDNTQNFSNGLTVNKVGRTTGWASGQVTSSCVTVNVSATKFQQHCQTIVENPNAVIVRGGDSGSPIFTTNGGTTTLVGILWGGEETTAWYSARVFSFQKAGALSPYYSGE